MRVGLLCLLLSVVLTHSKDCPNKSPLCNYWGNIGECHANPRYMLVNCKGACDPLCIISPQDFDIATCVDSNPNCVTWSANGECTANPYYMLSQCKKSCYPPCIALDVDLSDVDCEHDVDWKAHKAKFGLTYGDIMAEQEVYKAYCRNRDFIDTFNKLGNDFEIALNKFSHMTPEEFAKLNKYKPQTPDPDDQYFDDSDISDDDIPDSLDWRDKGAVTPIVSQGGCGSCFAFGTVAAIESQNMITNNKLYELSQQQVLDCSYVDPDDDPYGNNGCMGGNPGPTYDYIKAAGGIETNESYPYDSEQYVFTDKEEKDMTLGTCAFDANKAVVQVTGFVRVTHFEKDNMDADAIKKAVATKGPVTAAIDTSGGGVEGGLSNFAQLHKGVFNDDKCDLNTDPKNTDHIVLIIGYGTSDEGIDYWIVKNSYGTDWGQDGFFYIQRGVNKCWIESDTTYPIVG